MEIKNGNARCLLGGECGQKSAPFVSELSEKRPANSRPPKTRFPPPQPPPLGKSALSVGAGDPLSILCTYAKRRQAGVRRNTGAMAQSPPGEEISVMAEEERISGSRGRVGQSDVL